MTVRNSPILSHIRHHNHNAVNPQMFLIPKSNFEISIALWGHKAPINKISQITTLPDTTTIITGSLDGQIVIWRTDPKNSSNLQPRMMLLGHTSEITSLSRVSFLKDSKKFVASSLDGQMSLWDAEEGRCIDAVTNSAFIHRKIIPYDIQHYKQTTLFCCGDYAEILVMDPNDLNVLFTLTSRVEPDWMAALSVVRPFEKHDVAIGISMAGVVKLWSLLDCEKKDAPPFLNEEESQILSMRNVHSVACSELNTRMMLIISPNCWQIIDLTDLKSLTVSETTVDAVNGSIIDIDKVAIGFADSNVVLFQLPRSRLTGRQVRDKFGERKDNIGGFDHPFVFAVLKGNDVSPLTPIRNVCFYFSNETGTVIRGDQTGTLSIWHIPKQHDVLMQEYLRKQRPLLYDASANQSMTSLWKLLAHNSPPSIVDYEVGKSITSTLFIANHGKLLIGREDGSIVIRYAIHAIMKQLLDFNTPEAQKSRILIGHNGAVTTILYPYDLHPRYDPNTVISGGIDFSVIVWNIATGGQIHKFCVQGGPILRLLITPYNSNVRIQKCICAIASDNSAALLSLNEQKCILLASRQLTPIVEIKFRPLDDFMLLKCEDHSVYVWQMETANLDRIVSGIYSDDVMMACEEQVGLFDAGDEAGAAQAIQLFRALKNKNVSAFKKIVTLDNRDNLDGSGEADLIIPPPIRVTPLTKVSEQSHIVTINLQAVIMGLLAMDREFELTTKAAEAELASHVDAKDPNKIGEAKAKLVSDIISTPTTLDGGSLEAYNVYIDTAKLIISLLYAWNLDPKIDQMVVNSLKIHKPKGPLNFGLLSHKNFTSLYLPLCGPKKIDSQPIPAALMLFDTFAKSVHWQINSSLTTIHLVSIISVSNTLMSLKNRTLKHVSYNVSERRNGTMLHRKSSVRSLDSTSEVDVQNMKQIWSLIAAMHCVNISEMVENKDTFCNPKVELLARKWQDSCIEIREASQALLIREFNRLGVKGREDLIHAWSQFLPVNLDSSLSIFGSGKADKGVSNSGSGTNFGNALGITEMVVPPTSKSAPPRPPVPARPPSVKASNGKVAKDATELPSIESCNGIQQIRKNQATAIVLLGVIGAEFNSQLQNHFDLARATSHSLLELLISPPSLLLPLDTPLRRAAIDLIGKGFTIWQPHLDISKVLLGLLELASSGCLFSDLN
uniref:WD_REPEATS_REGION domain-containing protein n=1 Tax=Rhabditophanes sp. KR3021 TaxID=114890 RepID=A0AC35TKC0_9BILA